MTAISLDYRKIVQIAVPLAAALIVFAASHAPAQAQGGHMLVIPASDGYGFDDCLGANKACGRVIADAWCEAHGMAASVSFGRADDVTASLPASPSGAAITKTSGPEAMRLEPGSFIVNCTD